MNLNAITKGSLDKMTGAELVTLHNDIAAWLGDTAVKRFAAKADAIRRTWAKVEAARAAAAGVPMPAPKAAPAAPSTVAQPEGQAPVQKAARKAPPVAGAKAKATQKARTRRGTNLLPTGKPVEACRAGSKQAILVDMLSRKEGATMPELLEALSGGRKPWTEPTVRSGFGWDLMQKGYGVRSRFGADGVERFHLLVPEGQKIAKHAASAEPGKAARTPARLSRVLREAATPSTARRA